MKKIDSPEGKDLKATMKLVENKEFSKAHKVLLKLADIGSARAQYALGLIYHNGDIGDIDHSKAAHYFKLSAKQKFEPAMYCYAIELAVGAGVKCNAKAGFKLMQEVAAMGYQDAIEFLQGRAA